MTSSSSDSAAILARLRKSSEEKKICGGCHRPDAELRCSRCKKEWYCDTTCQKARWPKHKFFCEISITEEKYSNEMDLVGKAYEIKSIPFNKDGSPRHPNFDFAGVGRRRQIGDLGPNHRPGTIWKSMICYSMGIPLMVVHDLGIDRLVDSKDPTAVKRAVKEGRQGGNQFFTFLMADPITGYALPEFQVGLGDCEIVRGDGKDISEADARFLWTAFDHVMDYFSMGRGGPKNYKKFFQEEQEKFNEGKVGEQRTTFMDAPTPTDRNKPANPALRMGP